MSFIFLYLSIYMPYFALLRSVTKASKERPRIVYDSLHINHWLIVSKICLLIAYPSSTNVWYLQRRFYDAVRSIFSLSLSNGQKKINFERPSGGAEEISGGAKILFCKKRFGQCPNARLASTPLMQIDFNSFEYTVCDHSTSLLSFG